MACGETLGCGGFSFGASEEGLLCELFIGHRRETLADANIKLPAPGTAFYIMTFGEQSEVPRSKRAMALVWRGS